MKNIAVIETTDKEEIVKEIEDINKTFYELLLYITATAKKATAHKIRGWIENRDGSVYFSVLLASSASSPSSSPSLPSFCMEIPRRMPLWRRIAPIWQRQGQMKRKRLKNWLKPMQYWPKRAKLLQKRSRSA